MRLLCIICDGLCCSKMKSLVLKRPSFEQASTQLRPSAWRVLDVPTAALCGADFPMGCLQALSADQKRLTEELATANALLSTVRDELAAASSGACDCRHVMPGRMAAKSSPFIGCEYSCAAPCPQKGARFYHTYTSFSTYVYMCAEQTFPECIGALFSLSSVR